MRHDDLSNDDLHRECWDLLPWVANERASRRDLARIEAHLRDCPECREELEQQRRLRNAIRAQEAVVLAPQTSLQKLMQRIDAGDAKLDDDDSSAGAAPGKSSIGTSHWPRWLSIAAAVQGVAIAALLAIVWLQSRDTLTAPRFTTLTSSAPVPHGAVIRVVFAEGIAHEEVNALLRSIDAQIVAGPSDARVYTLALAGDAETGQRVSVGDALAQLRSDNRVVFAESAVVRTESP